MAKQAREFIAATVADPELAEAFAARFGDRSVEEAANEVVAFARERGYQVDRDALLAARAELAEAAQAESARADAPLSDEALATVSGGILGAAMGVMSAGVTAATGSKRLPSAGTVASSGAFNPISKNFWWPF